MDIKFNDSFLTPWAYNFAINKSCDRQSNTLERSVKRAADAVDVKAYMAYVIVFTSWLVSNVLC